jgi:hypothetical protein
MQIAMDPDNFDLTQEWSAQNAQLGGAWGGAVVSCPGGKLILSKESGCNWYKGAGLRVFFCLFFHMDIHSFKYHLLKRLSFPP